MASLSSLGWRVITLLWVWTIGLAIMLIALLIGGLYAILDIISRSAGQGPADTSVAFGIKGVFRWFITMNQYAFLGRKPREGFQPIPPLDFT